MKSAIDISDITNHMLEEPKANQFMPQQYDNSDLRTIKEVEGAIISAKRFPRNEDTALAKIKRACQRSRLAETAIYQYPRAGTVVEGASIRLAETVSLAWGNIQKGVRELKADNESTTYEAFAIDLETNVRASRIFTVKHGRYTKKNGFTKVSDPRDIYEVVMSHGARRLRACILEIIPQDIIEEALEICNRTLQSLYAKEPIEQRRKAMFDFFKEQFKVSPEAIGKRYLKAPDALNNHDLLELKKVAQSLRDGMSKAADWFGGQDGPQEKADLNKEIEQIGR